MSERKREIEKNITRQRELSAHTLPKKNDFTTQFQEKICSGLGSITDTLGEILENPKIGLDSRQKKELGKITKNLVMTPAKLLSGEIDLVQCLEALVEGIRALASFFLNPKNSNILTNVGTALLSQVIPFGNVLAPMANSLLDSDLPEKSKTPLARGTKQLSKAVDRLTQTLEQNTLKPTQRRP